MLRILAALFALLSADIAVADALDSWTTWSTAQPYVSKQIPPGALIMRGIGTDAYYVAEIDPATGAIPVDIGESPSIAIDFSGTPGQPVPSKAGYMGGTDGTNLRGLKTDTSGELQVDVLSSTLPSGAATSAKQDSQTALLTTIDADTSAIAGAISGTEMQVDVVTLPVDFNAGANSSTTQRVTEGSRTYSDSVRKDYSGGSVTTAAWTELIASTAAAMNYVCITDQSGQIMEIGTGAAAAETRVFLVPRGFSGCIPLRIAASTRVAVKAVSATASTGDLVISGMN